MKTWFWIIFYVVAGLFIFFSTAFMHEYSHKEINRYNGINSKIEWNLNVFNDKDYLAITILEENKTCNNECYKTHMYNEIYTYTIAFPIIIISLIIIFIGVIIILSLENIKNIICIGLEQNKRI